MEGEAGGWYSGRPAAARERGRIHCMPAAPAQALACCLPAALQLAAGATARPMEPLPSPLPQGHGVPSPPAWLLQALAQRLRRKTGLSLFNFDVIVPMHLHRRRLPHGTSAGEAAPSGGASQARLNGGSSGGANAFAAAAAQAVAEVECAAQHAAAAAAAEEPVAMELSAAGPSAAAEAAVVEPPQAAAAAPPGGQAQQQQAQQADQQQAQGGQQTGAAANTAEAGAAGAGAAAAAAGGEEEPGELLYHLIDINYFPGGCWRCSCGCLGRGAAAGRQAA